MGDGERYINPRDSVYIILSTYPYSVTCPSGKGKVGEYGRNALNTGLYHTPPSEEV